MTDARRVLVVDDEVPLAKVIASYLVRDGYEVQLAHTGTEALAQAHIFNPDLVILDVMLPGVDGIEVCRVLRERSDCYILMLTARDTDADKVNALSTGADDYVVKPCSPRELLARTEAMLRRPRTSVLHSQRVIVLDELTIDLRGRNVNLGADAVDLTRTEFDILALLAIAPGVVVSRSEIITAVWGPGWFGDEQVVDVHMAAIRRKLHDKASAPLYVRTIRGIGYSFLGAP